MRFLMLWNIKIKDSCFTASTPWDEFRLSGTIKMIFRQNVRLNCRLLLMFVANISACFQGVADDTAASIQAAEWT